MTESLEFNKLIELGYLNYVEADSLDDIKEKVLEWIPSESSILDIDRYEKERILGSSDYRSYGVDAEDLAEGGASEAINQMKATLSKIGLELRVESEDFNPESYSITINGKTYVLYSENEVNESYLWWKSSKRFIMMINELLSEQGSKDRLYVLYPGGNEQILIYLTDELRDYMVSIGKEKPLSIEEAELIA